MPEQPAALSWQETRKLLLSFVARRVESAADAEDIVQEVLLKMVGHIDTVRERPRLEAWMYQIARNAIIDHHRRAEAAQRRQAAVAMDRSLAVVDAGDSGVTAALATCLKPMVSLLPAPYREAITLTEYDGLTQAEAAGRAGVSVPGMKSRVQRARARLGELLAACCRVELDARRAVQAYERRGSCPC